MRSLTAWLLLAFACGACVLQTCARLPPWPWAIASGAAIVLVAALRTFPFVAVGAALTLGFGYAAFRADVRLADQLAPEWEGEDIRVVGIVDDLPARYDTGVRAEWRIGVFGTSLYYQSAELEGRWFGFLVPMGLPRPGFSKNFMTVAVRKTDDPAADREFLETCLLLEMAIVGEDTNVMSTMRFRPGTLTRSDRTLGRYFKFLRAYPRAHPSRPFIT